MDWMRGGRNIREMEEIFNNFKALNWNQLEQRDAT